MAIQFARCAYVSRSSGGNACRKAAYNERTSITCERTGETFCFAHKTDGAFHEILLPEGAHEKFRGSSVLWNEAERCERRKDSQVAKEVVLALPDDKGVTHEDRVELARRFAVENFVEKGVAVQIDIHAPDEEERNWHAHLLIPTRRFLSNGKTLASKKATDLDPVVRGASHLVVEANVWGEIWRDTQNTFFEEKGYDIRVDSIGILAQEHLGPVRMRHHMNQALERAQALEVKNEKLALHSEAILEALTRHTALFTDRDVDRFLDKHVPFEKREALKDDVMNHLSVIPLFHPDSGEKTPFFTTTEVRLEEEKLLRFADKIAERDRAPLGTDAIEKGLFGKSLNGEQTAAYTLCTSGQNLCIIQGRAGVGKSYVLDSVREAHEAEGFRVLGLAPTHKVKTALKDSGFEEAKTCHEFLFALKNERDHLNGKTLVVVDEAGMMGSALSIELFNVVKKSGAKLILVGDDRQLSSIERPGAFGILAESHSAVELQQVRRQTVDWQKAVSEELSQGNIKNAVDLLQTHGAVVWQESKEESFAALLKDWSQSPGPRQILAQRNIDVDALNEGAREIMRSKGALGDVEITCATQRGQMTFAVGDRVQLTKTDKNQNLENGRFGEITKIDPETKKLTLKLDNQETREVDPATYDGLRHGYAATVYKAQGATLAHVYVLHGNTTNQSTSYVALTRQTESLSLYVSKDETPSERDLIWQMGRATGKGTSLSFDTHHNIDRRQEDKPFIAHLKHGMEDLFTSVKDVFHRNDDFYRFEKSVQKQDEVTLHSSKSSRHMDGFSSSSSSSSGYGNEKTIESRMWESEQEREERLKSEREEYEATREGAHDIASLFRAAQDVRTRSDRQEREDFWKQEERAREHERIHEEHQRGNDGLGR